MMAKTSQRLLKKMIVAFPELGIPQDTQLIRARGLSDGCGFKWSSAGVGLSHFFSYETMRDLIKAREIGCWWSRGIGGAPQGWEIYSAEWDEGWGD